MSTDDPYRVITQHAVFPNRFPWKICVLFHSLKLDVAINYIQHLLTDPMRCTDHLNVTQLLRIVFLGRFEYLFTYKRDAANIQHPVKNHH